MNTAVHPRLSVRALSALDQQAQRPGYDRGTLAVGIVHLGIGAFHRAHQAWYTDKALALEGGHWGICGVSLRSSHVRDTLEPQNNLYTLQTRSSEGVDYQVIGSVLRVLVATQEREAVLQQLAEPAVSVVTVTITEKGYGLHQATGELDAQHPDIKRDLASPDEPVSATGFLVAGLERRRRRCLPGLTIMSCDNLHDNGRKLAAVVVGFARRINPELAAWIQRECRFPCTMVDRIVPATTPQDVVRLSKDLHIEDEATVVTEPFSQWVIEDNFAGPVPAWDKVGAQLVADVAPFEEMKLRLLNASHSILAYAGVLAGFDTVDQAMDFEPLRRLVRRLMLEEMVPTLSGLDDFDIEGYCAQLLRRFGNPALAHRTRQIAMDGSQKIPQRLLPALQLRMARHQQSPAIVFGMAAWIRYTLGRDESGHAFVVEDPMAERFCCLSEQTDGEIDAYLQAMLGIGEIFEPSLSGNRELVAQLGGLLRDMDQQGVRAVLAAF